MKLTRRDILLAAILCTVSASMVAQGSGAGSKRDWRAATPAELEAVLPARAPVEKEHIETEMRSASGVIDSRSRVIAAVVLITAGYAANGKYYYYLLAQTPIRIGSNIDLAPGSYAIGWTRSSDGLLVHIYEAETGVERGTITAHPLGQPLPIVSIKIWPPSERSVIQIGRFVLPYSLGD
ncbi:hypothetical protein [Granulicella sp. L46]|uniref:hypothetical protein n=1 Tax=Granulicella sp. L46 TaxID=1641865 RepID=UPI00131B7FC3|nr:hypothetical protein [Granulicella sp. L46]